MAKTKTELVLRDIGGVSTIGKFRLDRRGLMVDGEPEYSEWAEFGYWLQRFEGVVHWAIGDWLNYGEEKFGELASQAIEATGMSYGTLANIKWVSCQFSLSRRREKLTFSHHLEAASLPPKKADSFLDYAEAEGLSSRELKKHIADTLREEARVIAAADALKELPKGRDQGVKLGDFREVVKELEPNSVDLIFTDPPYDRETLPLYGDLAEEANRILKPGGSLICYLGQYQIHEVCNLIIPHMRLWWTLCCRHTGQSSLMNEYGIRVRWKPMLWFVKGTRGDKQTIVEDLVESVQEKDVHEWQQGLKEAVYFIDKLTLPGHLVFDPFCGGGTTATAAKQLGRRWLTCDIDKASVILARKRLHDCVENAPSHQAG